MFQLNDKKHLDVIRTQIDYEMGEWAKEKGLIIKADRISYARDGESCTVKVNVTLATAEPQESKDFKRNWRFFEADGLRPEHLGASMLNKGHAMKLVGLNLKSRKYPLLFETQDGRRYGFTTGSIKWLKIEQGEAA